MLAYAPANARSRYEYAVYQEFFGHNGQGIMNYVLIQAKDSGDMIRVTHLNETVRVCPFNNRFFIVNTCCLFRYWTILVGTLKFTTVG